MPGQRTPSAPNLLLRTRDAASVLGVSPRQIEAWRRSGLLTAIPLPGVRAIRFSRNQVVGIVHDLERQAGIAVPDGPGEAVAHFAFREDPG